MGAGVSIQGLVEFRRALREAPEKLQEEAASITEDAAAATEAGLEAEYPVGPSGRLQRGVTRQQTGPLSWVVRSTSPIAFIFEKGTIRRFTHKSGANRGIMPAADILIPLATRQRALMVSRLESMVERQTGATFSTSSSLL